MLAISGLSVAYGGLRALREVSLEVRDGEFVAIVDADVLPPGARSPVDRDFDEQIGYRTKSMLVVAMRALPGETIDHSN